MRLTNLIVLGIVIVIDALGHNGVEVEDGHSGDDGHQDEQVAGGIRHLLQRSLSLKQRIPSRFSARFCDSLFSTERWLIMDMVYLLNLQKSAKGLIQGCMILQSLARGPSRGIRQGNLLL